jgi:dTDP-glucose pyrophosphorylase
MNASPQLVQIVVDSQERVVGMVTDGDVRRALVDGVTLDSPVTECMHTEPTTARSAKAAAQALSESSNRWRCVPVVDETGRIVQVVGEAPEVSDLDTGVIMAGGFGKRLGEQTRETPKPLLEVAGQPIIWHLVKDLENHGIKRVLITIHYLGDQIRSFFDRAKFNIDLEFIEEKEPLGTAGGLGFLPPSVDGPILILNSDIVTRTDYRAMMAHHQLHERDATVAAVRHESEIPFGVLDADHSGKILGIQEKPRYTHHVSAGIYLLQSSIYRLAQAGVALDMPDLLRKALEANLEIGLFPIHEYWMDLGRPDDINNAQLDANVWKDGGLRRA